MTVIYLWENHVDRVVMKLLDILGTEQYGKDSFLKVDYSLRVIIGDVEKIILLGMFFGMMGYLSDFMIAFGTIILLRTCTGGIQVDLSSDFLWGEVKLPECLRRELEEDETGKFDE